MVSSNLAGRKFSGQVYEETDFMFVLGEITWVLLAQMSLQKRQKNAASRLQTIKRIFAVAIYTCVRETNNVESLQTIIHQQTNS